MKPTQTDLSAKSMRLLNKLLRENPKLRAIYEKADSEDAARHALRAWAHAVMVDNPSAQRYYRRQAAGPGTYAALRWADLAAIRILDYLDHAGMEFKNPFRAGKQIRNDPFQLIWLGVKTGSGGAKPLFFEDMIHLFHQLTGQRPPCKPDRQTVLGWMSRWKHGREPEVPRSGNPTRNESYRS